MPLVAALGPAAEVPCQTLNGSGAEAERLRKEVTTFILASLPTVPIGEILPSLPTAQSIPYHEASARVRNCFQKSREIETWADLAQYAVADLFQVPNAGKLSVETLVDLALQAALAADATAPVGGTEPGVATQPTTFPGWEELSQILEWAAVTRSTGSFGDTFTVRGDLGELPSDVAEAWGHLQAMDLTGSHRTRDDSGVTPLQLLSGFSDRAHLAFCRRNLSTDTPTLEEIGSEIGVTRERVRQLQQKAEEEVRAAAAHQSNRRIRWAAHDLTRRLGVAFPREMLDEAAPCDGSEQSVLSRSLLLWLAGPYEESDGWLVRRGASLDAAWDDIHTQLEQIGKLTHSDAIHVLRDAGIVERAAETLLQRPKELISVGTELLPWAGSVADKAETVLQLLGRPATDQELVDHIGEGHARRSLRNRLMEEERFMRTDRDHFALRAWDVEEYSGISEEIAERIERAGGEALLDQVVNELLDTFDIAETSIRQYASAHRFVQQNGKIRLRSDEEIAVSSVDAITVAGVFRPSGDRLVITIDITSDTLRGSGRGVARPVAVALGATPGNEVVFAGDGQGEVRFVWRLDSASGPAMGSLADLATAVGVNLGDRLYLDFQIAHRCVRAYLVDDSDPLTQLVSICDGEDSEGDLAGMARCLGVETGAVRAVLRQRADDSILALLPAAIVDESLRGALQGLTDVLGDLD